MASKYPLGPESADPAREQVFRRVIVHTASTSELKDFASLRGDFSAARAFLDTYLASDLEDSDPAAEPLDALWIAAVTMYGRAFSTGRRHAAHPQTNHMDSDDLGAHRYFLALRNKHIAHSVNGFEMGFVFADLQDPAVAPGIARIGESHTRLMRLSRPAAENLRRLCEEQVKKLTLRINVLHRQVATELLELGQTAVYALPQFAPPIINDGNPLSPRL